jgi:hypothetical protein
MEYLIYHTEFEAVHAFNLISLRDIWLPLDEYSSKPTTTQLDVLTTHAGPTTMKEIYEYLDSTDSTDSSYHGKIVLVPYDRDSDTLDFEGAFTLD